MAEKSNKIRAFRSRRASGSADRTQRDYFDYNLLAVVILLTCFGLIMLYSSSAYEAILENNDDMAYFRKQAWISAGAFLLVLIVSQMDYHFIVRFAFPLYLVSLFLLIITKFVGLEVNGARRWLGTTNFSFQPAEIAKLAVILLLPYVITRMGRKMKGIKNPLFICALGGLAAFCTGYFTQNLSTAIIIMGITVVLVFVAHPKTAPFVAISAVVVALTAAVVAFLVISNLNGGFRVSRIQVWLHPEDFSSSGGYQILQALYAIGNGGFFGKGLGNSTQKLGSLPEAQNDMIFSIICEELGVFGAALVILLFVFLLYRLFFIAQNAPDLLGSLIVTGIFVHIALQVLLNIAVVTNLIPTTGITLPFISYGGTSILFLMAEMAVALSVSRQIKLK